MAASNTAALVVRLGSHITVPLLAAHAVLEPSLPLVLGFRPFQDWARRLGRQLTRGVRHPTTSTGTAMGDSSEVTVHSVTVTDIDLFARDRIGFVKFRADIRWTDTGDPVPGIVFCRGGSVAVLVVVKATPPTETSVSGTTDTMTTVVDPDARWVVLTVQPRVPIATMRETALPAGMLDGDDHFAGVAARELEEECGITITASDLIDLTDYRTSDDDDGDDIGDDTGDATLYRPTGLYPSAGGSDEFIRIFLCEKQLPLDQIHAMQHRRGGLWTDGERIHLKVVPMDELLWHTRDMKAVAALALYQNRERVLAKSNSR